MFPSRSQLIPALLLAALFSGCTVPPPDSLNPHPLHARPATLCPTLPNDIALRITDRGGCFNPGGTSFLLSYNGTYAISVFYPFACDRHAYGEVSPADVDTLVHVISQTAWRYRNSSTVYPDYGGEFTIAWGPEHSSTPLVVSSSFFETSMPSCDPYGNHYPGNQSLYEILRLPWQLRIRGTQPPPICQDQEPYHYYRVLPTPHPPPPGATYRTDPGW